MNTSTIYAALRTVGIDPALARTAAEELAADARRETTNRLLIVWPLALGGAVWLGMALERYGAATVGLWIVAALGFLVCSFSVITLLDGSRTEREREYITPRWLVAGAVLGGVVWVISSLWLAMR